jgi:hemin uptake protein HemP
MSDRTDRAAEDAAAAAAQAPTGNARRDTIPPDAPVVEAATLFGRHRQVVIGHNGCRYVLRITQHGKLILNK